MIVEFLFDDLLVDHPGDELRGRDIMDVQRSIGIGTRRIVETSDRSLDTEDRPCHLNRHHVGVVVARDRDEDVGELDSGRQQCANVVCAAYMGGSVERAAEHDETVFLLVDDRNVMAHLGERQGKVGAHPPTSGDDDTHEARG